MSVLKSHAKTLGVILGVGVASFAVTATILTAVSAQAAATSPVVSPSPSASTAPKLVPELAIGQVSTVTSGQEISFPVDAYKASPTSENLVLSAEYQAMKSCMSRYGLDFTYAKAAWTVPATNHDYDRLFGLIDLAEAQKFGYHTGETLLLDGEAVAATANANPGESAPNYLLAAMGTGASSGSKVNGQTVPQGGCFAEARSKLGDSSTTQTLYEYAVNYGLAQSDADPRVIAAFGSWSACMGRAGFSYTTPMEAIDDPQWATTTPSATEVKAATADVNCKVAVNLTGLRVAVAAAWQSQYINGHTTQFTAMKSDVGQQVVKANAILQK